MKPRYDDIQDVPLPTDIELISHLQLMLEQALRRQLWIMLLDSDSCPIPLVMPTDLPREADPNDIFGLCDFLSCLVMDFPGASLVLTFERPGRDQLTDRDRRWLRLLREAAVTTGFPFRGPYLLLGSTVRQVPPDEYLAAEWIDDDE